MPIWLEDYRYSRALTHLAKARSHMYGSAFWAISFLSIDVITGGQMDKKNWDQQIKWGLTAFAVIAAGVSVVFFILHIQDIRNALMALAGILAPAIYGGIMAYLMSPIYNRVYAFTKSGLTRYFPRGNTAKHMAKTVATTVSTVVLLLVAVGLISMILPEIYNSVLNVVETLPAQANALYNWLQTVLEDPELRGRVLNTYNSLTSYVESYVNSLLPNIRNIIGSVSVGIWNTLMLLKNILIGVIVMMYLLNIKETLVGQARKLVFAYVPKRWAAPMIREFEYINEVFGGFITGKLLDSLIIGILCFVVLSIMNMPYTMLVSVIVGVTNVIPFFGPFIGAIPSFILILLVSPMQSLYFLIFILVLQQFDGNILGPKILGDSTGLSSFWVLFSILLFGGLFGFVGMIIAVPAWAVILHLIKKCADRLLRKKNLPLESVKYLKEDEAKRL